MVGRSSGMMMWKSRCQGPAPSTRAASMYSMGMAWIAASMTTMLKPANIQVVTRIRAGRAVVGLASQAWAYSPRPTARRTRFAMPQS